MKIKGKIYHDKNNIIVVEENKIYILTQSGNWDEIKIGEGGYICGKLQRLTEEVYNRINSMCSENKKTFLLDISHKKWENSQEGEI